MSRINIKHILILLPIFLFYSTAYSNDSTATVAAGGIQFKKSKEISIENENLIIKKNKIEVSYRFYNHSNNKITETVAFPLPRAYARGNIFPGWDEDYIAHAFLQENPGNERKTEIFNRNLKSWISTYPFIDFERKVDGETQTFSYRVQAIDPTGKDITELLKVNNVPLSATFLAGFEEAGELERNPVLKATLNKLKLLDKNGLPMWSTQTTYYWQQTFEPKKFVLATHQYSPGVGELWLYAKNPDEKIKTINQLIASTDDFKKSGWRHYCLTPSDEAKILKRFRDLKSQEATGAIRIREVKYILTTGANWNGPIKKFHLEVIPPNVDTLVIGCWPGKVEKLKDGRLISNIENFTPRKELDFLFIKQAI